MPSLLKHPAHLRIAGPDARAHQGETLTRIALSTVARPAAVSLSLHSGADSVPQPGAAPAPWPRTRQCVRPHIRGPRVRLTCCLCCSSHVAAVPLRSPDAHRHQLTGCHRAEVCAHIRRRAALTLTCSPSSARANPCGSAQPSAWCASRGLRVLACAGAPVLHFKVSSRRISFSLP